MPSYNRLSDQYGSPPGLQHEDGRVLPGTGPNGAMDSHTLISTSRQRVHNDGGPQVMAVNWQNLINDGYTVKLAKPTQREFLQVFDHHPGQKQERQDSGRNP